MPEISTFSKFKDWLLLSAVAGLLAVIGLLHNSAIQRITVLETKADASWSRVEAHAARLATIEAILASQRDETFRRLDRIERKLDLITAPTIGN